MTRPTPPDIDRAYRAFPAAHRSALLALRDLVLDTAADVGAGDVDEYLAWDQPSYRVVGGTPIRVATHDHARIALFVSCRTSLVEGWRDRFAHLEYAGSRAVILDPERPLPENELREMIAAALEYHVGRRRSGPGEDGGAWSPRDGSRTRNASTRYSGTSTTTWTSRST